jgi:alpha-glucosidase
VDLSFLQEGNFTMEVYQDGVNADRYASDYKKTTVPVNENTKLTLPLASGGWVARIHQ